MEEEVECVVVVCCKTVLEASLLIGGRENVGWGTIDENASEGCCWRRQDIKRKRREIEELEDIIFCLLLFL